MTIGLIKLICVMQYGNVQLKPEDPCDTRTFFVPPGLADGIAAWYRERGWIVSEEPI